MSKYEPASVGDTVQKLGGAYRVANYLGVTPAAVFNMMAQNHFPERHHCRMLEFAVAAGLPWRPPSWTGTLELRLNKADADLILATAARP